MKTVLEILEASEAYLAKKGFPSPRIDAEWLIAHVLKLGRLELYLQFERPLTTLELDELRPLLRRRTQGEPLQYILASAAFYNCQLSVGPGVLVPRPETERLVELALECKSGTGAVLDLCTGSGAILFALAGELDPRPEMVGVDASEEALTWAMRNRDQLGFTEIQFLQGDLFEPVTRHDFRLITANPPYVSTEEYAQLPIDVREHEPARALLAGDDGLDVIRCIIAEAGEYLVEDGQLVMEIGETQGAAVKALLEAHGWREVVIRKDYTRRDRIAIARKQAGTALPS